jgi:protein-S-isoprenylcysteine O-methyltransferase Ste14
VFEPGDGGEFMREQVPEVEAATAAEVRQGRMRSLTKTFGWFVLTAAILFGLSGNWRWLSAWAYLAIAFAGFVASAFALPAELLNERSGIKRGAKAWDKWIVSAFMLIGIAVTAVAALDVRYGWSPSMPVGIKGAALIVVIASFWIVYRAMRSNRFFSPVVRIQTERGHSVISSGPYAFVRHPGYVGIILSQFAVPLLLGSTMAFGIGLIGNVLLIVRTELEDRTLRQELPGYADYARRVRFRLIPGIW